MCWLSDVTVVKTEYSRPGKNSFQVCMTTVTTPLLRLVTFHVWMEINTKMAINSCPPIQEVKSFDSCVRHRLQHELSLNLLAQL